MSRFDWNAETVELLRQLIAEGLSGSYIAKRLGCSRSAVLGKIHRAKGAFGTLGRPVPAKQRANAPVAAVGEPGATAVRRQVAPPPMAAELPTFKRRLADIVVVPMGFLRAVEEGRCLFFAADPMSPAGPDMPVCGHVRAANNLGKRYCERHLTCEQVSP